MGGRTLILIAVIATSVAAMVWFVLYSRKRETVLRDRHESIENLIERELITRLEVGDSLPRDHYAYRLADMRLDPTDEKFAGFLKQFSRNDNGNSADLHILFFSVVPSVVAPMTAYDGVHPGLVWVEIEPTAVKVDRRFEVCAISVAADTSFDRHDLAVDPLGDGVCDFMCAVAYDVV